MKESDMYPILRDYLESRGYSVYAEVEPRQVLNHYGRADIIAYSKPAVCIVEMKTSLSIDLIEQAYRWIPYVHYIYVAVPKRKKPIPTFVRKMLSQFKIGILEVDQRWGSVHTTLLARFNRPHVKIDWDKELLPQHQTWAPGGSTSDSGYVTPYKLTIERVTYLLKRNPHRWFSIREILDYCETHYKNPKSSLANALMKYESDTFECKIIDGVLKFRLR